MPTWSVNPIFTLLLALILVSTISERLYHALSDKILHYADQHVANVTIANPLVYRGFIRTSLFKYSCQLWLANENDEPQNASWLNA